MKKVFYLFLLIAISFVCSCDRHSTTRTDTSRDPFSFVSGDKISIVSHTFSFGVHKDAGTITLKNIQNGKTKDVYLNTYSFNIELDADPGSSPLDRSVITMDGIFVGYINKKPLYTAAVYVSTDKGVTYSLNIVFSHIPHVNADSSIIGDIITNPNEHPDIIFGEFFFCLMKDNIFYAFHEWETDPVLEVAFK
jgi:hypothetical protein